ncbi:uncharacterized protein BO72DRAFT_460786 [Aspergillus fijiensis CBS 313.89]|uniref:Uncharacterized protein n=1 Tax=Aspergillus fijiensis CBS 313.89 TaxID=1448319 RepID=A0A8G1VWC0_9EURO|nr:uncharacterized protein BO72DRAFT_460786 [Aspergillus fijiensis CBS 313.89]RAK75062.1 hypothetical protein BO72DRAFT_460786 [Aspergillus fijiensis CBS 313.89]
MHVGKDGGDASSKQAGRQAVILLLVCVWIVFVWMCCIISVFSDRHEDGSRVCTVAEAGSREVLRSGGRTVEGIREGRKGMLAMAMLPQHIYTERVRTDPILPLSNILYTRRLDTVVLSREDESSHGRDAINRIATPFPFPFPRQRPQSARAITPQDRDPNTTTPPATSSTSCPDTRLKKAATPPKPAIKQPLSSTRP